MVLDRAMVEMEWVRSGLCQESEDEIALRFHNGFMNLADRRTEMHSKNQRTEGHKSTG